MEETLYSVVDLDNGHKVVAKDMTIDIATILVKALFQEYYNEINISYGIVKQESDRVAPNED